MASPNDNGVRRNGESSTTTEEEQKVQFIRQALAGLQLPHMPQWNRKEEESDDEEIATFFPFQSDPRGVSQTQSQRRAAQQQKKERENHATRIDNNNAADDDDNEEDDGPTIRIMVVSDIDLPSASALAEYTLLQNNEVFDASRIDVCIACGPFCRDEDLVPYLRGKQRRQHQKLLSQQQTKSPGTISVSSSNAHPAASSWSSVFFRGPEETAALEGLLTAAISQLESIVCRVVFCPGSTDPLSTHSATSSGINSVGYKTNDMRFTPNSRNIHRRWLPLAPGLGCAGLLFLNAPPTSNVDVDADDTEGAEADADEDDNHSNNAFHSGLTNNASATAIQIRPPRRPRSQPLHYDSDDEHDDEDDTEGDTLDGLFPAEPTFITNVYGNKRMGADGYCQTLEHLLKIAPRSPKNVFLLSANISQSILVTHYFQPPKHEDNDRSRGQRTMMLGGFSPYDADISHSNDATDHEECDDHNHDNEQQDDAEDNNTENSNKGDDDIEKTNLNDEPEGGSLPWPLREHTKFVESTIAQEQLALEIASGSGSSQAPRSIKIGNVQLVIPGSLRERGEFCLVDMSLKEVKRSPGLTVGTAASKTKASTATKFAWRVGRVEFHNMTRLP